jgi:hypothetical protein
MACQKNILNFFKPTAVKRPLSYTNENERDVPNKKAVADSVHEKDLTSKEKSIEPNQESPFFSNYLKAKIKLISKRCPALHVNIGDSWFEALSPEFGKPYFVKVLLHCDISMYRVDGLGLFLVIFISLSDILNRVMPVVAVLHMQIEISPNMSYALHRDIISGSCICILPSYYLLTQTCLVFTWDILLINSIHCYTELVCVSLSSHCEHFWGHEAVSDRGDQ